MRVTGGIKKGQQLICPKGQIVRPTTDLVRQALFNVIFANFFASLEGLDVLDLFAGTGALGIEAISRGARSSVFIEKDKRVVQFLRTNIDRLGLKKCTKIIVKDAYSFLNMRSDDAQMTFDLIFCDPPYGKGHLLKLLEFFDKKEQILKKEGVLIIEERSKEKPKKSLKKLELVRTRDYGDSSLFFFKRRSGE